MYFTQQKRKGYFHFYVKYDLHALTNSILLLFQRDT